MSNWEKLKKTAYTHKIEIIWFAILCGFIKSLFLNSITIFKIGYFAFQALGLLYLCVFLPRCKPGRVAVCIIAHEALVLFSTCLAGSFSLSSALGLFATVVFVLILDNMLKRDARRCIVVLYTIFELLVYLNFLAVLFFPNGLYNADVVVAGRYYYFTGHRNSIGIYFIIALTLGVIYEGVLGHADKHYYSLKKRHFSNVELRLLFLTMIGIISVLKVWSALALLGCIVFIILMLWERKYGERRFVAPFWAILINLVIYVVFVVAQRFDLLAWLIEGVLHRDLTLSGRTGIWSKAMEACAQNPIWGMGENVGKDVFGFTTAHNRYLNTLFTGGIVLLVEFIVTTWLVCAKAGKHKKSHIGRICGIYFGVVLSMAQLETYNGNYFWVMYIITDNLDRLLGENGGGSPGDNRNVLSQKVKDGFVVIKRFFGTTDNRAFD